MRISVTRRLVRVGPLVIARGACTRSTPLLDGARIRFTRMTKASTGPGEHVVEQWDAGGVRIRLSRSAGPGYACVRALDVGWRGLRTPNPHRWPLTRAGRLNRRVARMQRRWVAVGGTRDDGMASEPIPAAAEWPFI